MPLPMTEPYAANLPANIDDEEIVLAEEVRALPARPVVPPAVQTAAVAVTGFVAGAATLALVHRRGTRRPAPSRAPVRARPGGTGLPPIVSTRRFLVDVHLLGRE